jgi:hypothetical protein
MYTGRRGVTHRPTDKDTEYVTYRSLCYYLAITYCVPAIWAGSEANRPDWNLGSVVHVIENCKRGLQAHCTSIVVQDLRRQADNGNEHRPSLIPHHHRPAAST